MIENSKQQINRNHLSNIDFLRGIAAISVLIWHYQHFFYPQAGHPLTDRSIQPFYDNLKYLYEYGGHAVQFFWIISGFVFFHTYKNRENLTFNNFFWNRFSRLYPLHLLTLLLVASLQFLSNKFLGYQQIYPYNDFYHFLLNLFMASHWGFQHGWSFNAPTWSISVEIVIYGFFFIFAKIFRINIISTTLWLILSLVTLQVFFHQNHFAQCITLFILGGLIHEIHDILQKRTKLLLILIFTALCVIITINTYFEWTEKYSTFHYSRF